MFYKVRSYGEDTEMTSGTNSKETRKITVEASMAGILALLIDEREQRTADDKDAVRTEVLLADAGLTLDEIAALTGRKYDTVRMAVSRGRAKRKQAG